MIVTPTSLDPHGIGAAAAPGAAGAAEDAGRPQPFGDFSAFGAPGRANSGQVSAGQVGASADPAHAARAVAAHLLAD